MQWFKKPRSLPSLRAQIYNLNLLSARENNKRPELHRSSASCLIRLSPLLGLAPRELVVTPGGAIREWRFGLTRRVASMRGVRPSLGPSVCLSVVVRRCRVRPQGLVAPPCLPSGALRLRALGPWCSQQRSQAARVSPAGGGGPSAQGAASWGARGPGAVLGVAPGPVSRPGGAGQAAVVSFFPPARPGLGGFRRSPGWGLVWVSEAPSRAAGLVWLHCSRGGRR